MAQKYVGCVAAVIFVFAAFIALGSAHVNAAASTQTPASVGAPPPAPADVAEIPADAEKSASGLAWKVLKPGHGGNRPTPSDVVVVNYDAWTSTGRIFDSSTVRQKPSTFPVGNIAVKGMAEAVQLLTVGERRRFWLPAEIAFNNAPGKPQGMCVFEIELVSFKAGPPVNTNQANDLNAPPDVAAPPKDAQVTKTGLAYKVLREGKGKMHPSAGSTVTVHYTLWKPDGTLIESSLKNGEPATFPLNRVIRGWTEGVQLMVSGEKCRFWIPGKLAYDGVANRPQGMLVFDIELLGIQ